MSEQSNIKPIKFQALSEDVCRDESHRDEANELSENPRSTRQDQLSRRSKIARERLINNFSLEFTYPAVIFDNVWFTIDRSEQESNFLLGYLSRLKRATGVAKNPERVDILKSINLNVPYGSIFGLLGPSSCGKTTLLRCLVGLLKPESGSIRLFGHETKDDEAEDGYDCSRLFSCGHARDQRSRTCKVPGSNVGYMPQDLGLYEDFSISQLLTTFGRYMKMESDLIESRIKFMASFLDLPDTNRQISSLSGGQKRRVSFAIACLHMPPLIILDEPTVGVDPLLRQSIWKYLRRLADEENKTIIITTHYIEEAAQADQVALMRAGQILVQDSPSRIMEANNCDTLEKAFLRICNGIKEVQDGVERKPESTGGLGPIKLPQQLKLYPQQRFNQPDQLAVGFPLKLNSEMRHRSARTPDVGQRNCNLHNVKIEEKINKLLLTPEISETPSSPAQVDRSTFDDSEFTVNHKDRLTKSFGSSKLIISDKKIKLNRRESSVYLSETAQKLQRKPNLNSFKHYRNSIRKTCILIWALLYKNYRRNVNSIPLLAFQFMLPMIQMISFSLCVGGRPSGIGLGLVNLDRSLFEHEPLVDLVSLNASLNDSPNFNDSIDNTLLSDTYLSFIDTDMINIINYPSLKDALEDVRKSKLWAAMEIGANFTDTILQRFDLENFYQLDSITLQQSVIKLYPDRSNKVLDMICHRSLVNSYRKFILSQFDHFRKLPIELKEPIFDIKPNLISNSIDGYTESIAAGLLASLTYIMAAGLTTFIMVVERSAGILERTYTSGVSPVAYLLAHAVFRSIVMMIQIAAVMFLTFYILQQPLVGSMWLAYTMLITLNLTGISYGLLISSLVSNQNGAALTIVSSLVVKITLSGILWPFEAIPKWLRLICYAQPLTMPVQALKSITLKGAGLDDRTVQLGFLVALFWLLVFLIISSRRFKFYQH